MLKNVLAVVDEYGCELFVEKSNDKTGLVVTAVMDDADLEVALTPAEARAVAAHLLALAKEVDGGN